MLKKFFINVLLLFSLFFVLEFLVYVFNYKYNYAKLPFQYNFGHYEKQFDNIKDFFTGQDNIGSSGRLPDGLKYKNTSKHSIAVFGCSFAFGQYLEQNQTFSYKLSEFLKTPVYNRALSGGGIQHMYKQTVSSDFYNDIASIDTVIYILIDDHFRRLFGLPFTIYDNVNYLSYKIKNNILVADNDNPFVNFLRSLYLYRFIKSKLIDNYINNKKNAESITDTVLIYFLKSRENLEKHYNKKINFYVIYYGDIHLEHLLTKKLQKNNFYVISTKNLTDIDLTDEKYIMKDNGHPNEYVWNILTPLIAQKLY